MKIVRGTHNIQAAHFGAALAIGNFDGVHLGHKFMLQQLKAQANTLARPTMVMTFEPHPVSFFAKQQQKSSLPRLTSFRQKMEALEALGIDFCLVLPFNQSLAALSAEQFIEQVLVEKLKPRYLLVGHDFRFGKQRKGDVDLLLQASNEGGFSVVECDVFAPEGERVSSTNLRQALQAGDMAHLRHLLGRPYQVRGRVQRGDGRGRQWEFPTANLALEHQGLPLPYGIYVVEAESKEYGLLQAVASYGVRPTVGLGLQALLEVHVLEGNYDLYDTALTVKFYHRLREEIQFEDVERLKAAIREDCRQASAYFATSSML